MRREWQEKVKTIRITLNQVEQETQVYVDDLNLALMLMSRLSILFDRLGDKDKSTLLQIILKKQIVIKKGEILAYELFSPFQYLDKNIMDLTNDSNLDRSGWVPVGTPTADSVRGFATLGRFLLHKNSISIIKT